MVVLRLIGGGGPTMGFFFNSMRNEKKEEFSKTAPSYRIVCPGLNLHARCKNNSCSAFEEVVYIPKGFSLFNIGK